MEHFEDSYPLSPLQHAMLLESLSDGRPGVNFDQISCAMDEDVDAGCFEQAWQRVVERHATLRISVHWENLGTPQQDVHRHVRCPFQQFDWRHCSPSEQELQWQEYLRQDRLRGFDFATPPLIRVALFRTQDRQYRYCWSGHHLLLDGHGAMLVLNEVNAHYEALRLGGNPSLAPAPQFREYIDWYGRQDWSAAEAIWREELQGCSPTSITNVFSSSKMRAAADTWAEFSTELSPETSAGLRRLARGAGVTLSMTLQGGWALLLSRYVGSDDVVFGEMHAGRSNVPHAERIVGLLLNTLPVRVSVCRDVPCSSWLQVFSKRWKRVRDYNDAPFSRIQGWSGLQGERLFDSVINFQNPSWDQALQAQGGSWTRRRFHIRSQPSFPLLLNIYAGNSGLRMKLNYDPRRFDPKEIARLMEHYQTLLRSMAEHPGDRLGSLPMLTPSECSGLIRQGQQSDVEFPHERCVHELVQQQVERTPRAVAVVFGGEPKSQLTYDELNMRADRLAGHILNQGAFAGGVVGILVERSLELAVAVLGVLKAGAAYVPLDPENPPQRLQWILENSGIGMILTVEALRQKLPPFAGQVVSLDRDDWLTTRREHDRPAASPGQLAYVLYTSGSTGRPKGVAMAHRPLVNLISWQRRQSCLPAGARTLQYAPLGFDVSFQEIFSTWCSGGTLVLIPESLRRDFPALLRFIHDERIARLFVPVVALEQLAAAAALTQLFPTHLREVITAGEALRITPEIAAFFRRLPACTLQNQYGPTEAHVVSAYTLSGPPESWPLLPPIGRAIANVALHILDRDMTPTPEGIAGELFIGGTAVAEGYHRDADLTQQRFIPDPYSPAPGSRLYRTGDLVRRLPDGNLEFLGRLDQQVKIRGVRVELGEIESVLLSNEAVHQAVALVREDSPGDRRLVAYVVTKQPLEVREVRAFLSERLPGSMLPSAIVFVDVLPLTANGKVDRRALPKPDYSISDNYTPPRNAVEELVAGVWGEVLGVSAVGIDDDFFTLGGHSLNAMQVVARLRHVLDVEAPLALLFEKRTLADFCAALQNNRRKGNDLPELTPVPRGTPAPLAFGQERVWRNSRAAGEAAVNVNPMRFDISGPLNISALRQSFVEVVRRHDVLRTYIAVRNGEPVQMLLEDACCDLPLIDLSSHPQPHAEAERISNDEYRAGFRLTKDPLFRVRLLRLQDNEHRLLLTMHHLLYDGTSLRTLFRELAALYQAFCRQLPSPLPEPRWQYADFAVWERQWLHADSTHYRSQLTYWKQLLRNVPPPLKLPIQRSRPAVRDLSGCAQKERFSPEVVQNALQLGRRQGCTPFMTMLAALNVLLHHDTGAKDIIIGSYVENRPRPEFENLLGFFSNLLALRTNLSGDPTFVDVLKRVRESTLAAYAHQFLPFEELSRELQQAGCKTPAIQIILSATTAPKPALHLSDLNITPATWSKAESMPWGLSWNVRAFGEHDCAATFDTDLYDPAGVRRMLRRFDQLLVAVTAAPELRLSQLRLGTETAAA